MYYELEKAIAYQEALGAGFLKLEGDEPLSDSFGLDAGVTLTMALKTDGMNMTTNPDLIFRTPPVAELEELEVKHFGKLYGEDFCRRNIRRLYGNEHKPCCGYKEDRHETNDRGIAGCKYAVVRFGRMQYSF